MTAARWLFPLLVLLGNATAVTAQPTVIRDARLDAVRPTVAVGRGYGLATNTTYSSCLASARHADDTSYDLGFTFNGLDSQQDLDQLDRQGQRFVQTHLRRVGGDHRSSHAMLAILTVWAHVRPLDESQQTLTDGVADLLSQGHLSAFVSVCGTHYVRALRRRSSLYVLFTYEGDAADRQFEREFQAALSGFDLDAAESKQEVASDAAITAAAASHGLRIVASAVGLRAQPGGNIAFDMATYRTMVNQAFQAAQHDRAGIPDEMEVVPWLSHPVVIAAVLAAIDRSSLDLYATRQIIGESAERYLELLTAVVDARAAAFTAASCRADLERGYLEDGAVMPRFAAAYVKSRRGGAARPMPVTALAAALAPDAIARLRDEAERFALDLDLAQRPRAPVARCLAQLEGAELEVRYQTIPECLAIDSAFSDAARATLRIVDEFCSPELALPMPSTRAGG